MSARAPILGLARAPSDALTIQWESKSPHRVCEHDRLDTVPETELHQNVRDVSLERGVADVELASDLRIR
jgi:hypothetical protein